MPSAAKAGYERAVNRVRSKLIQALKVPKGGSTASDLPANCQEQFAENACQYYLATAMEAEEELAVEHKADEEQGAANHVDLDDTNMPVPQFNVGFLPTPPNKAATCCFIARTLGMIALAVGFIHAALIGRDSAGDHVLLVPEGEAQLRMLMAGPKQLIVTTPRTYQTSLMSKVARAVRDKQYRPIIEKVMTDPKVGRDGKRDTTAMRPLLGDASFIDAIQSADQDWLDQLDAKETDGGTPPRFPIASRGGQHAIGNERDGQRMDYSKRIRHLAEDENHNKNKIGHSKNEAEKDVHGNGGGRPVEEKSAHGKNELGFQGCHKVPPHKDLFSDVVWYYSKLADIVVDKISPRGMLPENLRVLVIYGIRTAFVPLDIFVLMKAKDFVGSSKPATAIRFFMIHAVAIALLLFGASDPCDGDAIAVLVCQWVCFVEALLYIALLVLWLFSETGRKKLLADEVSGHHLRLLILCPLESLFVSYVDTVRRWGIPRRKMLKLLGFAQYGLMSIYWVLGFYSYIDGCPGAGLAYLKCGHADWTSLLCSLFCSSHAQVVVTVSCMFAVLGAAEGNDAVAMDWLEDEVANDAQAEDTPLPPE